MTPAVAGRVEPTVALIKLSDESRDSLLSRLVRRGNPVADIDRALLELYRSFAELPDEVLGPIRNFGCCPSAPGAMLVRNLPVDPALPASPIDGRPSPHKSTFVSECVVLGLAQLIGEPIGYMTEKEGRLVHDIVGVRSGERSQTNQSSAVFLSFHNDTTYDPIGIYNNSNPDFLVLLNLRKSPDGKGRTAYVDARWLTERLDSVTVNSLRHAEFLLNAPGTYCQEHAGGAEVWSRPVPLIQGPPEAPEIAVSANGVKPLTDGAKAAWRVLRDLCLQKGFASWTLLEPGEALLIDNRKGLHAREPFTAEYSGSDRWLQRCYVRRSSWILRDRTTAQPRVFL